jgi:hypothetical protein
MARPQGACSRAGRAAAATNFAFCGTRRRARACPLATRCPRQSLATRPAPALRLFLCCMHTPSVGGLRAWPRGRSLCPPGPPRPPGPATASLARASAAASWAPCLRVSGWVVICTACNVHVAAVMKGEDGARSGRDFIFHTIQGGAPTASRGQRRRKSRRAGRARSTKTTRPHIVRPTAAAPCLASGDQLPAAACSEPQTRPQTTSRLAGQAAAAACRQPYRAGLRHSVAVQPRRPTYMPFVCCPGSSKSRALGISPRGCGFVSHPEQ